MTLAQLAVFFPAALLVALSPGANNLMAFTNATERAGGSRSGRSSGASWPSR